MSTKITTKKSIGIVLFNHSLNKILMIQKKITYAFADFIFGNYPKNSSSTRPKLLELFSMMTLQEKSILLSLKFEYIWYFMYSSLEKTKMYYISLNHYKAFINDGGKLLKQLVINTPCAASSIWEPPKGRRKTDESSVVCGMRELEEETNIDSDCYDIIQATKITYVFIENNVRYNIVYYVAIMKESKSTSIMVNELSVMKEINDIRWIPVQHLGVYKMFDSIRTDIRKVSKKLKTKKVTN